MFGTLKDECSIRMFLSCNRWLIFSSCARAPKFKSLNSRTVLGRFIS